MTTDYLESAKTQFEYYKALGERTIEQLTEEELFWKYNEESNSIAVIIKHLSGNMLSRWTDFLTADGEKDSRDREAEFSDDIQTKEEILSIWNEGWSCLFNSLNSLKLLSQNTVQTAIVYIRGEKHTIVEAINRQLAHYPYHVGQIVFIGKMLRDNEWTSLSIPRGKSKAFNDQMKRQSIKTSQ